jgi:menaquinone-dependent protoporphyrinogen oxidase
VAAILLLHHGVYGHTRQICERLQSDLVNLGHRADVRPLAGGQADPAIYDVIVIGASIRNGKHNPAVVDFIRANRALLENKPSAFFSVNLVARKPAKNTAETNPYVKAFIARSPWKPHHSPDHDDHRWADRPADQGGLHRLGQGASLCWTGRRAGAGQSELNR